MRIAIYSRRLVPLLSAVAVVVVALPNGAPICVVGQSNTRSPHTNADRNPQTGPIQVGTFDVYLDGAKLKLRSAAADPAIVNFYDVGANHTVSLQSDAGAMFKGALLLLSSVRDPAAKTREAAALTPTGLYKLAPGCESGPVAGVTHSESSLKSTAPVILRWDVVGDQLFLDVNVVVQNNAAGSIYYYSQYVLEARVAAAIAPAAAPAAIAPVAAPAAAAPTRDVTKPSCGLFRGGVFCPRTLCGIFGRALGLCKK